jgi:hypothetical protein
MSNPNSLSQDQNFYNMSFGSWGFRKLNATQSTNVDGEFYRVVKALTDSQVTVVAVNGDSLTSQILLAGDSIVGYFSDVTCNAGQVLAYIA